MLKELIELVERRGKARRLRDSTIARETHAVKSVEPVLSLGVRAASHADYWHRHAQQRQREGLAPATVRAELNYTAAVLLWAINTDTAMPSMRPASMRAVHDAIREAARTIGKQVKRFKALDRPARVSVDEYEQTVRDIESLASPHREICRVILLMGLRVSEAIRLHKGSVTDGMLFVSDRNTKTCADLLLPLPPKYINDIKSWVSVIEGCGVTYGAVLMAIQRAGFKWRSHDLRKMFRTKATVRGEDYLAVELIVNHSIDDVANTYLQRPPYRRMRTAINNAIFEYNKILAL